MGLALEKLGPSAEARWGPARSWIAKAAAAGQAEAQLRLAQIDLAAGDMASARANLEAAAAAGLPAAQFNLGRLAEDDGEAETARRQYQAAARQGHGAARFNLALLLLNSDDPDSAVEALAWLILAAETGAPNAAAARDHLLSTLTHLQKTRARIRADWLRNL